MSERRSENIREIERECVTFCEDNTVRCSWPLRKICCEWDKNINSGSYHNECIHHKATRGEKSRVSIDKLQIILLATISWETCPKFYIHHRSTRCDESTEEPHDKRDTNTARGTEDSAWGGIDSTRAVNYVEFHDTANNSDPVPMTRLKMRKAALKRPKTFQLRNRFKLESSSPSWRLAFGTLSYVSPCLSACKIRKTMP